MTTKFASSIYVTTNLTILTYNLLQVRFIWSQN